MFSSCLSQLSPSHVSHMMRRDGWKPTPSAYTHAYILYTTLYPLTTTSSQTNKSHPMEAKRPFGVVSFFFSTLPSVFFLTLQMGAWVSRVQVMGGSSFFTIIVSLFNQSGMGRKGFHFYPLAIPCSSRYRQFLVLDSIRHTYDSRTPLTIPRIETHVLFFSFATCSFGAFVEKGGRFSYPSMWGISVTKGPRSGSITIGLGRRHKGKREREKEMQKRWMAEDGEDVYIHIHVLVCMRHKAQPIMPKILDITRVTSRTARSEICFKSLISSISRNDSFVNEKKHPPYSLPQT